MYVAAPARRPPMNRQTSRAFLETGTLRVARLFGIQPVMAATKKQIAAQANPIVKRALKTVDIYH
jgi:hypothetical protein